MRGFTWAFAAVSLGFLAFSCGGEEFGGADDPDQSKAGESSIGEGGGGSGGKVGTGGSKVTPPEGGSGTVTDGGTGNDSAGMPTITPGGTGSGGSPDVDECANVPPELPGDCQKVVCSMGTFSSAPDNNDKPEPRGACDVPKCDNGEPAYGSDPSQCAVNQLCDDGQCICATCPNGKIPALSNTMCRLPAGVTVTANKTLAGEPGVNVAANVADGNPDKKWNSGAGDGILTITLPSPQAMTAIAVWMDGNAGNNVPAEQKYIHVTANIETDSGQSIIKSGNFSFAQSPTGALRLDFGPVKVKKITLTFESPSTWIASHEVIFEVCAQDP